MARSDSEAAPPVFSSEAAASGWDEGTEAIVDSDEPNYPSVSACSSSNPLQQQQRPRLRSVAAGSSDATPQQQQHRTPRASLTRRVRSGSSSQQQQLQQAVSSGGFKGRGSCRGSEADAAAAAIAAESWERRFATFRVRCRWTLLLVLSFFLILAMGHCYCMLLVLGLIVAIYKEIIQAKERREEERLPDFHLLKWYWFCVTICAIGLPWSLQRIRGLDPSLIELVLGYHSLGVYVAWFLGFMWFILSLRKSYLRYQFSQLGVMLVVLLFVVSQSLIQIANIYSGLIWFFLPTSLVIVNDIFAYLCGTAFGRTRLIRLSPKKTVEGYIGAAIITLLWAWVVGRQLERHSMFVCPQPYISLTPFAVFSDLSCTPSPVFVPRCTDSSVERVGFSWWESDAQLQQEQQQLQQQQRRMLQEHQQLMTQAAAADEQLLLLQAQQQQLLQQEEADAQQQLLLQQKQKQQDEVHALQHRLWDRLSSLESGREETENKMRASCRSVFASPFDFHAMVLGSFAAFFAPFGGFFASGFKRAVRIKDFGYFIPGHGGVTDRFDCQVVMGLFTFLYQKTFVPQIGQAEAAARRTAQQQQLLLLQQQQLRQLQQRQHQRRQQDSSNTITAGDAQQQQPLAEGADDPAVSALLHAAKGLTASQLANLQRSLEAIASAKAAAGD